MFDYAELGRRLRALREQKKLSLRALAELSGYSYATILRWERGEHRVGLDDLTRLGKVLGVSVDYFLGGGESKPHDIGYTIVRSKIGDILGVTYVPLIGRIRTGKPTLAQESVEDYIPVPQAMVHPGEIVFALRVIGDSMIGAGIEEGDITIIRQQDYIDYSGQIAVVLIGDEGTLKKVCRSEDGSWLLVAENEKYKPINLSSLDEVTIVGVYIGFYKQAKRRGRNSI